MSDRTLAALSWTVLCVLALAGVYFALIYDSNPAADQPGAERSAPPTRSAVPLEAVRKLRRRQAALDARDLRDLAGTRDDSPRARDRRLLAHARAAAEPVARRFFAAFAHYELGALDPSIESQLRATATARLARELVAAPPRAVYGGRRPALAELGGLRFVPREVTGGELHTAELVGSVDRAGARSPVAIELVRGSQGWRVSGVGR